MYVACMREEGDIVMPFFSIIKYLVLYVRRWLFRLMNGMF